MSFGDYNPNKKRSKFNRFYLQDGSNIYRILPPAHSLVKDQKIAQYWSVIWLTSPAGRHYVVPSILRKGKNGVVLVQDPLIELIEKIDNNLKSAQAMGDEATINSLKELQKRVYNKKFYAVNAINQNGEVGVLHLPYTSYQALENKLREMYNLNVDPIGIGPNKGLFFDFKKTKDERGRTMYTVDVATKLQKTPEGHPVVSFISSPISEEEAAILIEQVQDLTKLYSYKTADELALLATLKQEAFDVVFGRGEDASEEEEEELGNASVSVQLQAVGQSSPAPTITTTSSTSAQSASSVSPKAKPEPSSSLNLNQVSLDELVQKLF